MIANENAHNLKCLFQKKSLKFGRNGNIVKKWDISIQNCYIYWKIVLWILMEILLHKMLIFTADSTCWSGMILVAILLTIKIETWWNIHTVNYSKYKGVENILCFFFKFSQTHYALWSRVHKTFPASLCK